MVVPVDESDESRFRLLEPIRQLAAEQLAARGEAEAARDAHTQWYLALLVRLGERWRAGDDQGSWPVAARELPNLQVAFDHLVDTERIDDAQRFAVAGFGPVNNHFDNAPTFRLGAPGRLARPRPCRPLHRVSVCRRGVGPPGPG